MITQEQKEQKKIVSGKPSKTGLFSGRFCRPHIGHVITLGRLSAKYDKIIVVVLDYPEQEFSVAYRVQVLKNALSYLRGDFEVVVNKTHFGKISLEELAWYTFDVYLTGNHEVLMHVENLGVEVEYVERAFDYEATDDRVMQQIRKVL